MPTIPFPFTALAIPSGLIEIWSGTIAGIPSGWILCDGTNGAPDLQDKFVRGVNTAIDNPGSIGGITDVTINLSTLPAHNHTTVSYSHTHQYTGTTNDGTGGLKRISNGNESDTFNNDFIDPPNQNTQGAGSSQSHNNMPPFFEIAYIFKK